jgi:hypothetical protein
MSFKAVWGFDPEEVEKARRRLEPTGDVPGEPCEERTEEDITNDDRTARIPSGFEAQIYELRRMFRL